MKSSILKRVFLVGCPRSGTTLLQSMLMGHPRIASYPETHFFARGFGGQRRWILHETFRGWYLWYLLSHWLVVHEDVPLKDLSDVPISWSKRRMADTFRDVLDRRTVAAGRDIWIEKTPRHLHFIDVIREYIPSSVFVHIVRDGRAVVASLYRLAQSNPERWSAYRSVDAAIQRWNRCIRDTYRHVKEGDDMHIAVGYDSLVETPETTLQRLATFLGIDYDARMVSQFHEKAQQVVKERESWKTRTTSSTLRNPGLDKFRTVFSDEEQDRITSKLDWSKYKDLGYTPL